jgi:hypothetical protein
MTAIGNTSRQVANNANAKWVSHVIIVWLHKP